MMIEMNKIRNEMKLPDINEMELGRNHGIFLKIGIVSETTGFFINRNNEPTETTSETFAGEERMVVPASKWRGAERSYLLSEIRKVNNVIPNEYRRNMVEKKELLKNPTSLIYGDSSTGSGTEAAGIASRVFYDWAYSYEVLGNISVRLTHNTLSEEGTILHEDNGNVKSNAIFNSPYIKPGVKLIRYLTVENVSIEMLALVILAIEGTTRYGARTAILGDNMKNTIHAIGWSKQEKPISSFTSIKKCWEAKYFAPEERVIEDMKEAYEGTIIYGPRLHEFIKEVVQLRKNTDDLKEICSVINAKISKDWADFFAPSTKKAKKNKADEQSEMVGE